MAHSVSAKKRIRQNKRRQQRNRARKSQVKTEVRKVREAVVAGSFDQAAALLPKASAVIDKVASKGTIHKNKAARMKSRLTRQVNKARKGA